MTELASVVGRHGHRLWLVGGAVRDLALDRRPVDFDICSAAPPESIESWFERTVPVGRDFGTLLISIGKLSLQHTTFRTESSYADARRPESVQWGQSLEEDASRRDFTCNALYLDPLTDELADPEHGRRDLERGLLRAVGDAGLRFREDGLRLWRLVRFAGAYGLRPEESTLEGARASRAALRGVSPERVLVELERVFSGPGAGVSLSLLEELELLPKALPGLEEAPWVSDRVRRLAGIPEPSLTLGLAVLYGPTALSAAARSEALQRLDALRVSRETRRAVAGLWELAQELLSWPRAAAPRRSVLVRAARRPEWSDACLYVRSLADDPSRADAVVTWEREAAALGDAVLECEPWIGSSDLRAAGWTPGPEWGELLREAEDLQLDGVWTDRAEAQAWLRGRKRDAE